MRYKQVKPMKASGKYRQYNLSLLTDAYIAVKEENMPVATAAKLFNVPRQTLRDRAFGIVNVDTVASGTPPMFSLEEEGQIVDHLKEVAALGYGYTRQEVVDIASDFAVQLGKRKKNNPLTLNWFVNFTKRWPELRTLKPRALEYMRAKSASASVVTSYFKELKEIVEKYNLGDKPHLVFNVDEKGLSQNHIPPYVVAGSDFHPQAVTSGKSKTTTLLGCGSASGVAIPPFFVFAGVRMSGDLLKGATPGASGTVTKSGWSNSEVFRKYLKDHFLKFVPQREPGQHLLLMLDGHKSHITPGLVEWAKSKNIIIFVLPAHTSHILQPLDIGCYGPLQRMYNAACHKFMRKTSTVITRNTVCSLACSVYTKAFSADNLVAAFKKSGISPLDRSVITKVTTMPAEVFSASDSTTDTREDDVVQENESSQDQEEEVLDEGTATLQQDDQAIVSEDASPSPSMVFSSRMDALLQVKREGQKPPRRHIGRIVSGKPITEPNIQDKIAAHHKEQAQKIKHQKSTCTKHTPSKATSVSEKKKVGKKSASSCIPEPGPSHFYISDSEEMTSTDNEQLDEDEKCCVCKMFTPDEVRKSTSVIFTKWVKCDGISCSHWVHLRYCTETTVVRLGDKFYCPHCPEEPLEE